MIFRKKSSGMSYHDIAGTVGLDRCHGDIGIEIEVEGRRFEKNNLALAPYWNYHQDGSLRGEDNAEYVLRRPITFGDVPNALASLWAVFKKRDSVLDDSNRTSVHVHLNVQSFHLDRLTTLAALYFCFEEILTEWCGQYRVGNLFCLRAVDAPYVVTSLKRFIQKDCSSHFSEHMHYAGFAPDAILRHGSVEIRTLRGVTDKESIQTWVDILRRLYDYSGQIEDPRDIAGLFSSEGPLSFFDTILGDSAEEVRRGSSLDDNDIRDMMYRGIRVAQDLCYCRDWDGYKKGKVSPDPFGRTKKSRTVEYQADIPMAATVAVNTVSINNLITNQVYPTYAPSPPLPSSLEAMASVPISWATGTFTTEDLFTEAEEDED